MISEESVALKRALRLRKNSDFQRVRLQGRSIASRLLILAWTPNPQGGVRVGIVVSKRVSKLAVTRNYLKRLLGEAIRSYLSELSGDWDVVITVRNAMSGATFSSIKRELETALYRAKLLERKPGEQSMVKTDVGTDSSRPLLTYDTQEPGMWT